MVANSKPKKSYWKSCLWFWCVVVVVALVPALILLVIDLIWGACRSLPLYDSVIFPLFGVTIELVMLSLEGLALAGAFWVAAMIVQRLRPGSISRILGSSAKVTAALSCGLFIIMLGTIAAIRDRGDYRMHVCIEASTYELCRQCVEGLRDPQE